MLCVMSFHYYVVRSFLYHSKFSQFVHECLCWWMGMIQQQGFFLLKLLMLDLSCRFLLKWQLVEQFNYAFELCFHSITLLMKRIEQDINFKSNSLCLLLIEVLD